MPGWGRSVSCIREVRTSRAHCPHPNPPPAELGEGVDSRGRGRCVLKRRVRCEHLAPTPTLPQRAGGGSGFSRKETGAIHGLG